jgi:hypothetical protein
VHVGRYGSVREYQDVFLGELTSLPPFQEVEFAIDLVPKAEPISRIPYQMTPAELKELKEQLKELLQQGYIRPSMSLWRASVLFVTIKYSVWPQ